MTSPHVTLGLQWKLGKLSWGGCVSSTSETTTVWMNKASQLTAFCACNSRLPVIPVQLMKLVLAETHPVWWVTLHSIYIDCSAITLILEVVQHWRPEYECSPIPRLHNPIPRLWDQVRVGVWKQLRLESIYHSWKSQQLHTYVIYYIALGLVSIAISVLQISFNKVRCLHNVHTHT